MFLRQKQRALDKEILTSTYNNENSKIIDIKCQSREQIFSSYSCSGDRLNPEFCDYLLDTAKKTPLVHDITIKIHSDDNIHADEVQKTLKLHYGNEYKETKKQLKRLTVISIIMILLGILALSIFVLLSHFWDNFYISTIVEIAAWVFVWEAVDYFFLQRPLVKAKCLLLQKLYSAKIEIENLEL